MATVFSISGGGYIIDSFVTINSPGGGANPGAGKAFFGVCSGMVTDSGFGPGTAAVTNSGSVYIVYIEGNRLVNVNSGTLLGFYCNPLTVGSI